MVLSIEGFCILLTEKLILFLLNVFIIHHPSRR